MVIRSAERSPGRMQMNGIEADRDERPLVDSSRSQLICIKPDDEMDAARFGTSAAPERASPAKAERTAAVNKSRKSLVHF